MAAHRYWRLWIFINEYAGGSANSIAELELRESIGGADVSGSGTASASSSYTSPELAFDNNNSTWWSGNANSDWLKYDFGAGAEKDIVEFAITAISVDANQPGHFALQYSDDDANWTTRILILDQTVWGISEQRVFNSTHSAPIQANEASRFWRIRCLPAFRPHSNHIGICECQLRESVGGADVTGSGTPSASGEASGNTAARAFDDSTSTQWMDQVKLYNYLQYDFGSGVTKTIREFTIQNRSDDATYGSALFILQCSSDGTTWKNVFISEIQKEWALSETRTFTLTGFLPDWPTTITLSRDCTDELPAGAIGSAYSFSWLYPVSTVTLSIESGSLPPGLSLENVSGATYRIHGTPTTAGTYTFTMRATLVQEDASPPPDPIYTENEFTLAIGGEGGSSAIGICVAY